MAKLIYSQRFADELLDVYSPRIKKQIDNILFFLEMSPESGSKNVADSLVQEFGDDIRKFAIGPFDLVYQYFPEKDEVYVYTLIHQKLAW